MTNIRYRITFFSPWHCGSGLAAGADVDALVVKDKNLLPFVPGKTIKGLVKEAVENMLEFMPKKEIVDVRKAFGYFDDKETKCKGEMFFTNAELEESEQKAIISHNFQKHLYDSVASTAIQLNGIAKKHSLRRIEVAVPCELVGEIKNVPNELIQVIIYALKMVKRIGLNRNRGLGRCEIKGREETK